VVVPIALAGVAAAHGLANAAFGSPEGRGELFASAASGADLLPLCAATALAVMLLGLGFRVAARSSLPQSARALALPFACLPPLAFVLLELLEGLLHRGTVPWGEVLEPTFLAGLALQLPFALASYLVARLLLQAGDRLRALLLRERSAPPPGRAALVVSRPRDDRSRSCACGSRERDRAPPVGLAVSG
jgi:hypothetical protein